MIKTSRQLKDKIKNLTHGDSLKSQTLLRTYMMERFLERLAVSQYNSHFVLKGGMLVSSMVGIHQRATMDIDATVVALPLTLEDATRTIQEIVNIDLQDGVVFSITNAESIMEEHDYPGLRFTLIGTLDGLRQKVKIDISTGDAITPRAIEYRYPLMFEDRSLQIMSYNLETLLAEKLETIMYRGTSNTRMRDFYDIYMLTGKPGIAINDATLYRAFLATSNTRRTTGFIPQFAAGSGRRKGRELHLGGLLRLVYRDLQDPPERRGRSRRRRRPQGARLCAGQGAEAAAPLHAVHY